MQAKGIGEVSEIFVKLKPGNRTTIAYTGDEGIGVAAWTEKDIDKDLKNIGPKTQVLKVVAGVTGESNVSNFNDAFSKLR